MNRKRTKKCPPGSPSMIVYLIRNKIDSKCYIGQSVNCFEVRYGTGSGSSWWKYVSSPHLKHAIDKYGHENFEYSILAKHVETTNRLDELERYYIKQLNTISPNGYNWVSGGQDFRKDWLSNEQKDELALIRTGGRISCLLNNKTNQKVEIENLNRFCQENDLDTGCLCRVVSGELNYHKIWSLIDRPMSRIIMTSPNGDRHIVLEGQLASFCRNHNLTQGLICAVMSGDQHHHKGWTTTGFDKPTSRTLKTNKP